MNATRVVSSLSPKKLVPWARVERSAFYKHPLVDKALSASGVDQVSKWRYLYLIPMTLVLGVFYAAPLWGLATVAGPRILGQSGRTAEGDITVGSFIFAVALVVVTAHAGVWLAQGRPPKTTLMGSAALAFYLGAVSVFFTIKRGIDDDVPSWELWILPMVACVIVGGTFYFLIGHAKRKAPEPPEISAPLQAFRATEEYLRPVRESISRVSEADQALIRQDLVKAIDDLERRGLITTADANIARSAELGNLAVQMARTTTGGFAQA